MSPLRLGIISTAGINFFSIFSVIKKVKGLIPQAIASRNFKAAEKYANKYAVPQSYGNYQEILNLPYIDCVYIPLPNSMHAEWSIKALNAGKHVLCEKPTAVSEEESKTLIETQQKTGKILMEALHYRYHPIASKIEEIVRDGELGEILEIKSRYCQWLPGDKHIRYNKELKGGVLWDMGCYTIDAVRWLAGSDEAVVTSASMKMMHTGVDHTTRASLLFSNGIKASIYVTFKHLFPIDLQVKGTRGRLIVVSPFSPVGGVGPYLRIPTCQMWLIKGVSSRPYMFPLEATYYYQLCAFRDAIINGQQPITSPQACLANTKIIEAIQQKSRGKG